MHFSTPQLTLQGRHYFEAAEISFLPVNFFLSVCQESSVATKSLQLLYGIFFKVVA